MKKLIVLSLLFSQALVFAQPTPKSADDLSGLMGAISQVISENTKVPGVKETEAKITPLAEEKLKALQNDLQDCQTEKTTPEIVSVEKDGVKADFKKFQLKISGEKCPLEIIAQINSVEQTDFSFVGDFLMRVTFKSQGYKDKYKLNSAEATGKISAKAEKIDASVVLPVHMDIAAKADSLELGLVQQSISFDVKMEINLAQFSFNMLAEQTSIMKYAGVEKKAYNKTKMQGFTQPEVVYTINDQNVSASEYQRFIESFVMPGMVSAEEPNQPDSKVATSCTLAVFDKTMISVETLKTQMESQNLQSQGLVSKAESCMKDQSIDFQRESQKYTGQFNFGAEWISFSTTKGQVKDASVFVLYGDSAVQTTESDELLIGLQCKQVPACP